MSKQSTPLPLPPSPQQQSPQQHSPCTELWARDLGELPAFEVDWLWQGYLARGSITLLTSQWKTGKTTLVSLLLARLARGGQLAELPVKPGRAVVLSEESPQLWQLRHQRLKFGPHTCFMCRPFEGKPTTEQWHGLVGRLADLHEERGVDLVVVDPISLLLPPYFESHAERMQAALLPLSRLTRLGMAVLLLHHPKKGDALAGQAARGSGAACALVDVLLELSWHARADADDRRRRLLAWSRYDETPRERSLELTADGRDYRLCVVRSEDEFTAGVALIEGQLREKIGLKLSRRQLYDDWPQRPKPDRVTLWRWLDRAVASKQIRQEGTGTRIDPYRYWLPGDNRAEWRPDPFETLGL